MYQLQRNDINQASICLGSAFEEYPVFTYILPDREERSLKLKSIFKFLLNIGLLHGEVIASSKLLEGISIWYPSPTKDLSMIEAIQSGFVNLYFQLKKESFQRFIDLKNKKAVVRHQILQGKNYYLLDVLGVNPTYQGHGVASALLALKLKEIDQLGIQSYLETSKRENIDYYKKFGFFVTKEYKINELQVYCLIREPLL